MLDPAAATPNRKALPRTVVALGHLRAKRPGDGIPPARLGDVLGLRLARCVRADETLTWDHLRPEGGGT